MGGNILNFAFVWRMSFTNVGTVSVFNVGTKQSTSICCLFTLVPTMARSNLALYHSDNHPTVGYQHFGSVDPFVNFCEGSVPAWAGIQDVVVRMLGIDWIIDAFFGGLYLGIGIGSSKRKGKFQYPSIELLNFRMGNVIGSVLYSGKLIANSI